MLRPLLAFSILLSLLSLSLLVHSTPTPSEPFSPRSLPLLRRRQESNDPQKHLDNLIKQHQALKHKYGIVDEEEEEEVEQEKKVKRATGNVNLAGNGASYYSSIIVGTPPVTFEVVLDTGSADLVLLTTSTGACATDCIITAPLYDPSSSTSATVSDTAVSITYGTGSADGVLVKDTMTMVGFTEEQEITAADNVTDLVGGSDQTGLFGLAWRKLSQSDSTPFLQGLWESKQLTQPLFAFALAALEAFDVSSSDVVSGGVMTIGATNSSLYTGDINYIDLSSDAYWAIPLDDITVQGSAIGVSSDAVVMDTGTNTIAVPNSIARAIYSWLGGTVISGSGGLWRYLCDTNVNFTLSLGGSSFTMSSSDFNTGVISNDGRYCAGAVSSIGGGSDFIIGTPFLMSFYTVYRFDPPSFGIATLANPNGVLNEVPIPTSNPTASARHGSSTGRPTGAANGTKVVTWSVLGGTFVAVALAMMI